MICELYLNKNVLKKTCPPWHLHSLVQLPPIAPGSDMKPAHFIPHGPGFSSFVQKSGQ